MLEDPLGVDRKLQEVARVRALFRRRLRQGSAAEHAFESMGRRVSDELLDELRSQGTDDPLGPALLRWAYVLQEEHQLVSLDLELSAAWLTERHALDQPESGTFSLAELRARALADRRGAGALWFEAFRRSAAHAGDLGLRRAERRAEIAVLAEVPGGLDAVEKVTPMLLELAHSTLELTAGAYAELGVREPKSLLDAALGRVSPASWPAHLSVRALVALFDEPGWFRHAAFEIDELPAALGAASFLRGLRELGAGLRGACVARSMPFVTRVDPFGLEANTWGALLALLPGTESFALRRLGVAKTRLSEHRRVLARIGLVSLREAALGLLLRAELANGSQSARRAYPELAERALGFELADSLAGAWLRPKPGIPQLFAAFLLAAELDQRMTETHDEDWYRNPRAAREMRENGASAPAIEADPERLKSGLELFATRLSGWT